MNKSQYENYWKSRKPTQGYYSAYGRNGWTEKPMPRNSFPIDWKMNFGCGVVATIVFILLMVGTIGVDNMVVIFRFFFG